MLYEYDMCYGGSWEGFWEALPYVVGWLKEDLYDILVTQTVPAHVIVLV